MERPYISGPMSGYAHHNYPAFFAADEALRYMGYEPLNPAASALGSDVKFKTWQEASTEAATNQHVWSEYLKRDTQMVLDSDAVVLLPGWEKSKGACLEVVVAVCIGLPIYYFRADEWDVMRALHMQVYPTALAHLTACGLNGVRPTLVQKSSV